MESWVRAVVEAIHSSRSQAVIYLAGGASQVSRIRTSTSRAQRVLILPSNRPIPTVRRPHLAQALGWLLSVPGASSTVLEVVVPYSRASMAQLLGKVTKSALPKHSARPLANPESNG